MSQKKNEGILLSTEIRVVGSYTDRLLICYHYGILRPNMQTSFYRNVQSTGLRAMIIAHVRYIKILA